HLFRERARARACSMPATNDCHSTPFHRGDEIVIKTHSSCTLAVAAAVGLCALAGCNQRESSQETAKDASEARQDANKDVAEERKEAADTAVDNAKDQASAE